MSEKKVEKAGEEKNKNAGKKIAKGEKEEKMKKEKLGEKKAVEKKQKEEVKSVAGKEKNLETAELDMLSVVLHPLVSEKAVDKIEKENKLTFIVVKSATKSEIKKAVENEFNVRVDRVNIINDMRGRKKALVTINKQYKASDIAMKLGII